MQKYLLRFIVSLQFIFRQYGVVPSGIAGGFEALLDFLIVTKNLVTSHHKDVKDIFDSFGTWLQEDKNNKKKTGILYFLTLSCHLWTNNTKEYL